MLLKYVEVQLSERELVDEVCVRIYCKASIGGMVRKGGCLGPSQVWQKQARNLSELTSYIQQRFFRKSARDTLLKLTLFELH